MKLVKWLLVVLTFPLFIAFCLLKLKWPCGNLHSGGRFYVMVTGGCGPLPVWAEIISTNILTRWKVWIRHWNRLCIWEGGTHRRDFYDCSDKAGKSSLAQEFLAGPDNFIHGGISPKANDLEKASINRHFFHSKYLRSEPCPMGYYPDGFDTPILRDRMIADGTLPSECSQVDYGLGAVRSSIPVRV